MSSQRTARRLTKILSMIPYVIARDGVSVDELVDRFDYDRAELITDLNLVFLCGLPGYGPGELIDATIEEDEVWVDMADYFASPLRLSPPEALMLLASGMALVSAGQAPPALERAVDKLSKAIMPDAGSTLAVELTEPPFVGLLREAMTQRRAVEIVYTALSTDETTERRVEPWAVFSSAGNWYLSGFCHRADDERVFRIDRIRSVVETPDEFEPPEQSPAPEVRYVPDEEDVRADIGLGPGAAWVADYYPVEHLGNDRIRFSASDPAVVAKLLLRLGSDAELLTGDEVASTLDDYRNRLKKLYGGAGD